MNAARRRFARFVAGGATNTAVTHGLFVVLTWSMPAPVAYSVAYATGIVLGYVINTVFVFRIRASLRSALRFPVVYLVAYLVGLGLVVLLTGAGLAPWLAMPVVLAVNVPLTYVLTRHVLRGARAERARPEPAGRPLRVAR
ncbi:GtrA family protein [Nonomuraea cavernae]|uniref:GtrA/DPMS transmembrane domain-containing protein n=1 Tax=Nonomuraea cavernae TaxID=2045107 RepID=A0A917YSW1_9ACTN|nr:GtrA family protein [Nonomuraea cavernae]MCA2185154.1 GtrA family protein [Nonomuraea cavernae]GGO65575.1 hypothetical protein GCM10012289_17590 [Nonomuraea cavernae]